MCSDCSCTQASDETVSADCQGDGVPGTADVCPQRPRCKELHVRLYIPCISENLGRYKIITENMYMAISVCDFL